MGHRDNLIYRVVKENRPAIGHPDDQRHSRHGGGQSVDAGNADAAGCVDRLNAIAVGLFPLDGVDHRKARLVEGVEKFRVEIFERTRAAGRKAVTQPGT